MELTIFDISFRVLLAFVLSLSFGLERQLTKKPVGFGVFTLVATGSCLLAIVAITFSNDSSPLPLLGGVVTGIGFLGAGAIIRYQERAFGFTTAASIWAFAAIGMGIGVGLFGVALLFYLLIILTIFLDHELESRGFGHYSTVVLSFSNLDKLEEVRRQILENYKVMSMNFNIKEQEFTFSFIFSGHKKELEKLIDNLAKLEGIIGIKIE